jgi:hypothetical protein
MACACFLRAEADVAEVARDRFLAQALCKEQMVRSYPSILIYRRDRHYPERYRCDRTAAALMAFVDLLVPSVAGPLAPNAGEPRGRSLPLSRRLSHEGEEFPVYEAVDCLAPEPASIVPEVLS